MIIFVVAFCLSLSLSRPVLGPRGPAGPDEFTMHLIRARAFTCPSAPPVSPSPNYVREESLLRSFYTSLNGADRLPWFTNSSNHCCWFGLRCNEDMRIVEINFTGVAGVNGSLPENISQFSELLVLFLKSMPVGGVIPRSIGELTKLQVLCLTETSVTGCIPKGVEKMVNILFFFF